MLEEYRVTPTPNEPGEGWLSVRGIAYVSPGPSLRGQDESCVASSARIRRSTLCAIVAPYGHD